MVMTVKELRGLIENLEDESPIGFITLDGMLDDGNDIYDIMIVGGGDIAETSNEDGELTGERFLLLYENYEEENKTYSKK
jgi:hypothetical protein